MTKTILKKSIITEKASILQASSGQYVFIVNRDATKIDIKKAIKEFYGVDVMNVRIIISPKKTRLVGRGREIEKRPVTKKAIVRLKNNQTLDPNNFKEPKVK